MKLRCDGCGAPLSGGDLRSNWAVATCRQCGAVMDLGSRTPELVRVPAAPPGGVEVYEEPGRVRIRWNWKSPAAIFPATAGAAMSAVSAIQIQHLAERADYSIIGWLNALAFCTASVLGLIAAALMQWGSFQAELAPPFLRFRFGRFRFGRQFPLDDVLDVHGGGQGERKWGGRLLLRLRDGGTFSFGITQTPEQARYVASVLQRQLGLEPNWEATSWKDGSPIDRRQPFPLRPTNKG